MIKNEFKNYKILKKVQTNVKLINALNYILKIEK